MAELRQVQQIRIFLSSPGDVAEERAIARALLKDELPYDPLLRGRVAVNVVSWEDAPPSMLATQLDLPKINVAADLISAAAALTDAVASGEITPGEAASLGQLVGNVAQAVETVMNAERIARLEEALAAKNGTQ